MGKTWGAIWRATSSFGLFTIDYWETWSRPYRFNMVRLVSSFHILESLHTNYKTVISHQVVIRQSSFSHRSVIRQSSRSRWAIIGQSSSSHRAVIRQSINSRHPVPSTDQALPSCFYFRISWILMERPWNNFFGSCGFLQGLRSLKHWLLQKLSMKNWDQKFEFLIKK